MTGTIVYNPLPFQETFHNSKKPNVYLSGGYGCLAPGSLVETINGQEKIEDIKSGTLVKTWVNGIISYAPSSQAIPRLEQDIFLVTHDYGSFLASESHRIFLGDYTYQPVSACLGQQAVFLSSYSNNHHGTTPGTCHEVSRLGDRRLTQIALDSWDDYLACCRLYDQQLRRVQDIAQSIAPLLTDATTSETSFDSLVFEQMGVLWEMELKRNHLYQSYTRHAMQDSDCHSVQLVLGEANQTQALTPERTSYEGPSLMQSLGLTDDHHITSEAFLNSRLFSHALLSSTVTTIRSIEKMGIGTVYDLHVLRTNNYISGGMVHHNCGKTYSLSMKLFYLMGHNLGLPGGLLCPTLKMFKRDVLPTLREICDENQVIMGFHKTDNVFEFPQTGSIIYVFHSEDDGKSIRGPNLAFGLINEVTLCSKPAFDAFLARIRLKKAKLRQLAMSGSPEGFSWSYEYFIEKPRDDTDLIFGDTRLNIHISEDYVTRLMESYDEKMIQQYVEGKFVNLTGNRAAWAFDRQAHVKPCTRDHDAPIWISCDFNVYPMTATIWQRCGARDNVWLRAIDEVYINASADTWELADTIWDRLGGQHKQDCEIVIFPDPAGQARSTKSRHLTDIDILKQSGFKDIRFRSRIKSVRDCLNALNNLLAKGRILIDPKCKNLIADLERCILKSGGLEIDKSDGKRGHLLDGLKNMAEYEFGIKNNDVRAREFRIR